MWVGRPELITTVSEYNDSHATEFKKKCIIVGSTV